MIDEKKIGVAAQNYAWNNRSDEGGEEDELDKKRAFRSGIKWFKYNLCHSASEHPKGYTLILMEYTITDTGIKQYQVATTESYSYYKDKGLRRWLYLANLL